MPIKKRPKRRRSKPVQEPEVKPRESVIAKHHWRDELLAGMDECLTDGCDGYACVTSPDGRACHVFVLWRQGGSA